MCACATDKEPKVAMFCSLCGCRIRCEQCEEMVEQDYKFCPYCAHPTDDSGIADKSKINKRLLFLE